MSSVVPRAQPIPTGLWQQFLRNAPRYIAGLGLLGAYQFTQYWFDTRLRLAINAALIAGNPQESRVAKLRSFWETVTADPLGGWASRRSAIRSHHIGCPIDQLGRRASSSGSSATRCQRNRLCQRVRSATKRAR